ncbi:MAG: NYN domain-containing protein [Saprospiraceae bacterium]
MANNDKKKEEIPPIELPKKVAKDYEKVAKDLRRNTGFSRSTGRTPVKIIEVNEEETDKPAAPEEPKRPANRSTTRRNSNRGRNTRKESGSDNSNTRTPRGRSKPKTEEPKKESSSKPEINKPAPRKSRTSNTSKSNKKSTPTTKSPAAKSTSTSKSTNKTSSSSKSPVVKTSKNVNRSVTTTHAAVDPTENGPNIRIHQSVAILIDGNNIEKSIHTMLRTKKAMLDFDKIIPKLLQNRGLNRLIYFREGLNISEKLAERLLNHYHGSVVPCHKSADIPLTIFATQIADKVDTIIILSGDSDYVELVRYMKSRGVRVEIAAVKRTTASILIEEADHYVSIVKEDCFKFK